ncbi:expansin-B18-like [Papaver somniferum]|uniref:expansin-B18-like n=1 Tax=Papaver somniferum TaxID=3469 RepID=UPI000E6F5A7E|nr:expansin-B18-like [Papaver somniferum]
MAQLHYQVIIHEYKLICRSGACGYGADVGKRPFASMISAGGPSLLKNGNGCGNCYEVKCTAHPSCSGKPVRVVITDSCPGGPCAQDSVHFDLSGTAFGAMARPGQEQQLRNAGRVAVQYQRVKCNYRTKIVFKVHNGSNPEYFSTLVEYENTDSDIASIDLQDISVSSNWKPMQRLMSAKWKLNSPTPMKGPFSLRLKAAGKTIVAQNVIPAGWKPGATYRSNINF